MQNLVLVKFELGDSQNSSTHQLVSSSFQTVQHLLCLSHQELYERCDKLRRAAYKMATETEDNDTSLGLSIWYFLYLEGPCSQALSFNLV